jgi:hypothetical protein
MVMKKEAKNIRKENNFNGLKEKISEQLFKITVREERCHPVGKGYKSLITYR